MLYKASIKNLLSESRHYFYKLESTALCQILKENEDWNNTAAIADIFQHKVRNLTLYFFIMLFSKCIIEIPFFFQTISQWHGIIFYDLKKDIIFIQLVSGTKFENCQ